MHQCVRSAMVLLAFFVASCGGGGGGNKSNHNSGLEIGPATMVHVDSALTADSLVSEGVIIGHDPVDQVTYIDVRGELNVVPTEQMAIVTITTPVTSVDEVWARLGTVGYRPAILSECLSYFSGFSGRKQDLVPRLLVAEGVECLGQYAELGGEQQFPQVWATDDADTWELLVGPWDLSYKPNKPKTVRFLGVWVGQS